LANALWEEADSDLVKRKPIFADQGIAGAASKESLTRNERRDRRLLYSFAGKVGVLVEVTAKLISLAKNENFRGFVKEITLHIRARRTRFYVSRWNVPGKN